MLVNSVLTPATHRNDPSTAFEAERMMNDSGMRMHHKRLVLTLVCAEPGLTAPEIGEKTGIGHLAAQRRLSDLTGISVCKGEARRCTVKQSKLKFTTWWPL